MDDMIRCLLGRALGISNPHPFAYGFDLGLAGINGNDTAADYRGWNLKAFWRGYKIGKALRGRKAS